MRTGILAVLTVALMLGSKAERGATQANSDTAPAVIVHETRLGPTGGNGTRPFTAAVDTRRRRLFVLNRVPQCLSVIDLTTRRVIDVVPLSPSFEGWENSTPYIALAYDPRADMVLVAGGNSSLPSAIIAVSAATRRVAAIRTFPHACFSHFAFNAGRGEIYAANTGAQLLVLDSRSLATKRTYPIKRPILALASSEATGALYTVEASNPAVVRNGIAGPYSETRIVVRDPVSGRGVKQSPGAFPYPHSLIVDDARRCLYLVHGNEAEKPLYSSWEPTTISVLAQTTLYRQRRLRYPLPPSYGQPILPLGNPVFDAPRRRLITDLYHDGNLAVLNLNGVPHAELHQVEGAMYSPYRLGAVLPDTGQPVLLIDNAARLLNSRTLAQDTSVTLGASVNALFLDHETHRLLTFVDCNVQEFVMIDGDQPRRLFKSYLLPRTHLLAVDFARKRIYHVRNNGWGSGARLHESDFSGDPPTLTAQANGEHAGLIVTQTPDRFLRLLCPDNAESNNSLRRFSLDIIAGKREVSTVPLTPLSLTPMQLLYAPRADLAYVLTGLTLTVYSAKDLSPAGAIPLNALADDEDKKREQLSGVLTVGEDGQFGYYADGKRRQIIKFRLTDGGIVARQQLTFMPTLPLVDTPLQRLYAADVEGGRIVAIALF